MYQPLLPIGWRIVEIVRQRRRKTTNSAPTTLSAIPYCQYKHQANPFLSMKTYIPFVISGMTKISG
jgi:hypothetical protein